MEVPPELAVISVAVQAQDRDRETVLSRLTAGTAELRALLDDHAAGIERRETSHLQVHPEIKGRSRSYAGSVATTVTVSDFTVLGDLMLRLAGLAQVAVSGPWWRLRPDSTAGAEVRRSAIADALATARDYAAAVGARVDRLIEISDAGSDRPMYAMSLRGGAGMESAEPRIDLDPELQTVHASVVVRVAITDPTELS